MVSIFKAIRENDLQLLTYFIDSSIGDNHNKQPLNKIIQQQLKAAGLKNFDLNKRSTRGRTPLHIAVTWNRVDIAQALIDCPAVNVNLRDRENGWTALHRSLYMGNIEIARMLLAREDIDPSIKDWEGLSAFELFNSTVNDTFPKERFLTAEEKTEESKDLLDIHQHIPVKNIKSGGTDVYTWGYNTNYVLGHADSENRLKPERVKLALESQRSPYFMQRPQYLIQNVSMSKYHMAILTSDGYNNLLVCGFGRGGRLGLGKDVDTQFTPVPVQWSERIVSVALGRDHTLAVTENGNVVSFGNNSFGQLGYETDNKDEGQMQLLPRKIQAQNLKKQAILGAAASRIHSVVYTLTDIFTFGYNQGQLGYQQPDSNNNCQITPRKVSMSTEISQVVANDNATVILNKSHEIILLCNYNQQRLFLPVNRFPSGIVVHRSEPNYPVKLITSGSEYLGAVTNTGDVFIWTCKSTQNVDPSSNTRGSTPSKTPTKVSVPKRIWTSNQPHLAAVDGSLGQHGEIMICTKSGHVFIGRPDANGYKFSQIPYLQRCIQVCANSSGAFAAIRSEYVIPLQVAIKPSTLEHDLSSSLPHVVIQKQLQSDISSLKKELDAELLREKSKYVQEVDQEYRAKQEHVIRSKYDAILSSLVKKAWEKIETASLEDEALDIIFKVDGKSIYCHSAMIRCRSKLFKQLVHLADRSGKIKFKLNKSNDRIEITMDHCELASVLLLLDYIYTDDYQHPMNAFFKLPVLCLNSTADDAPQVKQIQKDLILLAEVCQLPELISSAQSSFSHKPFPSLQESLNDLLVHENGANVHIIHEDKQQLNCHEIILRQRCPFFKNLFQPNSIWTVERKTDSVVPVYLDHIPTEVMKAIIQYIYLDQDDKQLFNMIKKDTEESMLHYLLAFLCEADFLLLRRLKSITEKALLRFIKLRSATLIFEYANNHLAGSLKKACLQFITVNLPVFLGSSMLDNLPHVLIRDLETFVRGCQCEKMPLVQRSHFDFDDDLLSLEQEDTEFSESIFSSTRGDGSISTFDEVLVTYYPQKQVFKQDSSPNESLAAFIETDLESSPKQSTTPKSEGKSKRGVRVSLDNLENDLKPLNNQRRRSSAGWATTSTNTPTDQTVKPSLREIIETENQPVDPIVKSKTMTLKKISQKERKRLAQQQELAAVVESSSSSTKLVWGKVPTVAAKPISKIIAESSQNTQDASDRKGKKVYVREEEAIYALPAVKQAEDTILFNPAESFGSSFTLTPIRRLNFKNGNSSDSAKKSFETIQKQQEREENWLKGNRPKKNILRIQKEEKALESISQFYIQTFEIKSGEWCEIKRVSAP